MDKTAKFVSKYLSCGCCGLGFRTWKEYEDQDQDKGYGICRECQGIAEKRETAEMDRAISLVSNGLKIKKNKDNFDNRPRAEQEIIVFDLKSRNRSNNLLLKGKTLSEWSEILGIKRSTLAQRYYVYGWSVNRVLSI